MRRFARGSIALGRRRRLALWGALAALVGTGLVAPQPVAAQDVKLTLVGGFTAPRHLAAPPGDPSRAFVVESRGTIQLVEHGATADAPFLDIADEVCAPADGCGGESGMFSMAFAPDYASSGLFYVFFTRDAVAQHDLVIKEFRRSADPAQADEASGRDVLVIPHPDAANHNGGQLQFGPDGLLYVSTGDGGSTPELAQSLDSLLGKLLRIDPRGPGPLQYTIPSDNPFASGPGEDEIYSYGLRNPYRFSFDRLTGDLIIGDVGQSAWEEIDFVPNGGGRGANFGWRCFEGMEEMVNTGECDPLPANHIPPVHQYENPDAGSAAINGGYVVRDKTLPTLLGRYLYADTSGALGTAIHAITVFPGGSSGDAAIPGLSAGGVVSFGEDACGHVYVVRAGGPVSRIEPAGGSQACDPQLSSPPPPPEAARDSTPPRFTVDLRKARRAAKRGKVALRVVCEESCGLQGRGKLVVPGKDIKLAPSTAFAPQGRALLRLKLSRGQVKRLQRLLRAGAKAKAKVSVIATDAAGNSAATTRRIKQKR